MKKMELLAPAGNLECLVAAVQSGADAVYLSGKAFGARSFADNFDEAELEKAIDYCHIRGVKVYVTVNTLVLDKETAELCDYLRFLSRAGADGIIVQDMGVLKIARDIVPDLPIHASTQMTVHNSEGVKALEELGVKRVVLARELSSESIESISKNTNAELEVFGHGALCMCYSGQCLMSSIIGGRSGNRGKCAQPCRLPYSTGDNSSKAFLMSLKDLSSLSHIESLMSMGVASLKIEGRMKGPAYVAAVVGTYRRYLDNPHKIEQADIDLLDAIFNRGGLTDGYLTGKTGKAMFAFNKPDDPYRMETEKLVNELLTDIRSENRKLSLECEIEIKRNEYPRIMVKNDRFKAEYIGDVMPEPAKNVPITEESVRLQIDKTGGTAFKFSTISVEADDRLFLSSGALNILRRKALERFEEGYLKTFKRPEPNLEMPELSRKKYEYDNGYVCEVTNLEQLEAVKDLPYKLFYVPLHLIDSAEEILESYKERIVIVPPAIISVDEAKGIFGKIEKLLQKGFYGVSANNIALLNKFSNYRVIGGFRLNIFNSFALDFCKDYGFEAAELSPELNIGQIKTIAKTIPVQTMVYGRLPLMITENCVIKNGGGCPCKGTSAIIDRMGMRFPVIKDGESCRNVILNCKKTFMAFDMDKIKNAGISLFRVYFTDETADECKKVSDSFLNGSGYRPDDFTNGHFNKGVM